MPIKDKDIAMVSCSSVWLYLDGGVDMVLKPWASILSKFGGVLYMDHVRFDPCHPYIERILTL